MSEQVVWIRFDKDTGNIVGMGPFKQEGANSIPVPYEDVKHILEGKESRRNYIVQYNPKTKNLEFVPKHSLILDAYSVKDFIHELTEEEIAEADILLIQDIPNTCWKIQLGKNLRKNLKERGISLNHTLVFSITEKGDPNILYKTLSVHFSQVVGDNYYIIPFTMPFETLRIPVSAYTSKRFETYQFKRIYE